MLANGTPSAACRATIEREPWWRRRITGGLTSYWVYQHLGNLSPAELAVFHYAYLLSTDPGSMTDDDSAALRNAGFSDRQIVDITLAAAVRNYLSRALQALAVPVDPVPRLDEAMTTQLLEAARRGSAVAYRRTGGA